MPASQDLAPSTNNLLDVVVALEGEVLNIPFSLHVGKVLLPLRESGTTMGARPLWVCNPGPMTLDDFTSFSEGDLGG